MGRILFHWLLYGARVPCGRQVCPHHLQLPSLDCDHFWQPYVDKHSFEPRCFHARDEGARAQPRHFAVQSREHPNDCDPFDFAKESLAVRTLADLHLALFHLPVELLQRLRFIYAFQHVFVSYISDYELD